jgi:magnesium transporter
MGKKRSGKRLKKPSLPNLSSLPNIIPGRSRRKSPGLPPGSLIYTGRQRDEDPLMSVTRYHGQAFQEWQEERGEAISFDIQPEQVNWFDLKGLHQVERVERLGKEFQIHPLILEDILETEQRPKFEEYDQGFFLIARAIHFDPVGPSIRTEQIGVYVTQNTVVSFQEDISDFFTQVRDRLRAGKGKIRLRGADYLAYALIDTIVDHYYLVLDQLEELINTLEEEILTDASNKTKGRIHRLKREMLVLRRSVTPLREAINRFSRAEHALIDANTQLFIRDLYDHTIQVMDSIETYRDTLTGLQDLYLSELSYRMNSVMQVLTIISTIFIPLTFLAGVYGMNFAYMPELDYRYSYFILWGIMIVLFVLGVWYFRKKDWL